MRREISWPIRKCLFVYGDAFSPLGCRWQPAVIVKCQSSLISIAILRVAISLALAMVSLLKSDANIIEY